MLPGDFLQKNSREVIFSREFIVKFQLEQSCDLACFVYVDLLSSRNLRKTWHGHDLAGKGYDEACTCGNLQVTNSYFEVCRSAKLGLVIC